MPETVRQLLLGDEKRAHIHKRMLVLGMHSDLIALCLSWSGRWLKLALPALPLTGCRESTALGNGVDGGNRELMAVPAVNVIPIPDNLDFNQAASVSSRVFDSLAQRVVGPDHVITFGGNNNSG